MRNTESNPAKSALPPGLVYTRDTVPGIKRQRRGKAFCYRNSDGTLVSENQELQRIRSLAIPPAYQHVWICPTPRGHLQATGRDARGRKQYRYHPVWRAQRDARKYDRLKLFALALPTIRRRVTRDLRSPDRRVQLLATVVRLLDTTCGRIGNSTYARENGSYGLTTLRSDHAHVHGIKVSLEFQGKSGVLQHLEVHDSRLADIVRQCQLLSGPTLFSYPVANQDVQSITSDDVNDYLSSITRKSFSAKDFRTWHGSAMALQVVIGALRHPDHSCTQKQMLNAVAQALGNTAAVCRKSYVHPVVLELAQIASTDRPRATLSVAALQTRGGLLALKGLRSSERQLLALLGRRRSTRMVSNHNPKT